MTPYPRVYYRPPSYFYPPGYHFYAGATGVPGVRASELMAPGPGLFGMRVEDIMAPGQIRFGVPGWRVSEIAPGGQEQVEEWSTAAKVAIVLGGIAAVYFLWQAAKIAMPVSRKAAEAAGEVFVSRIGRKGGGAAAHGPSQVLEGVIEESPRGTPHWRLK